MRVTTFCDTCSNIACNIAKKVGCFGSRNYDYGLQPTCTGSIFVIKLIFTWSHFDISFPFIRGLFQSYLHILNGCSSLPMCIGIHSEVSWGSEVSLICLDWYVSILCHQVQNIVSNWVWLWILKWVFKIS